MAMGRWRWIVASAVAAQAVSGCSLNPRPEIPFEEGDNPADPSAGGSSGSGGFSGPPAVSAGGSTFTGGDGGNGGAGMVSHGGAPGAGGAPGIGGMTGMGGNVNGAGGQVGAGGAAAAPSDAGAPMDAAIPDAEDGSVEGGPFLDAGARDGGDAESGSQHPASDAGNMKDGSTEWWSPWFP